jgi:glyoxylase-like metal-dependent hydrolase (beta-lactamase superfamily II)
VRDHPLFLNAGNAGPFTLDGTRTYLVGRDTVAIIDPGPDVEDHVRALACAVAAAADVKIVLTHGHPDHAGAVRALAERTGASVYGPDGIGDVTQVIRDGDRIETDQGSLVAVHTPGHTREHLCLLWVERSALFAGDHLLGQGDTTWVAEYPGCVADYLSSLERLRTLDLDVVYPAHGPPLQDPTAAIDRFDHHRRARIRQVEEALARHPTADARRLLEVVYGDSLPRGMESPALQSLGALLEYVRDLRPS